MKITDIDNGFLFEMPQKIEKEEFGLNRVEINADMATNFLNDDNTIEVGNIKGHQLFFNEKEQKYGVLYKENDKILFGYYVKYEVNTIPVINKPAVTQVAVWRQAGRGFDGVADDIFFKYLLPRYGIIATDLYHTDAGHRFWLNRIKDALDTGFKVLYLDLSSKKIIEIKDFQQVIELESSIWGKEDSYQTKRLLIST